METDYQPRVSRGVAKCRPLDKRDGDVSCHGDAVSVEARLVPGRPVRKKPGRKKMGAVRQCQPATSREGTLNDRVSGRRP